MTTDYAAIRAEHLRRYGEDVGQYGALLTELYSDRTHFLFELLQNAHDAQATRIRFDLTEKQLEVRHNGRLFTEADVRGICAIKRSTKTEDPTQIGRFGIGFKSVYAYTQRPAIHCGDEHFAIENYVHPHGIAPAAAGNDWTTLQLFPFDRPDISSETACREISAGLGSLSPRTTLFLANLEELEWIDPRGGGGIIVREERDEGTNARRVTLLHDATEATIEEESWLVFERPVHLAEDYPPRPVNIAFLLNNDQSGTERVIPAENTELVAYFPTAQVTFLGFLIQGPFLTTPARDNILEDNTNKRLIDEIAQLTVDSLPILRDLGLLDVSLLQCLPLSADKFSTGTRFAPLYDKVRTALHDQPLMPTSDGTHRPGRDTRIARGADLRDLFSPAQLGHLLDENHPIAWIPGDITEVRTPELFRYLAGHQPPRYGRGHEKPVSPLVSAMEVDADAVVRRLNERFLSEQSDEWVIGLYQWLSGQRSFAILNQLRTSAILRREDGQHVALYSKPASTEPSVWLPPVSETTYPIIRRAIAANPDARTFFEQLGLTEPDAVDEVLRAVLPNYPSDTPRTDRYHEDLALIARAAKNAEGPKRDRLLTQLRKTRFLVGRNAASGERTWRIPSGLYEPTEELTVFLEGNPKAWFLDLDEATQEYLSLWNELGLKIDYAITYTQPDRSGYVVVARDWGQHMRGRDDFDPHFAVEHLDFAVQHPTLHRSRLVWRLLARRHIPLQGTVETSSRQDYSTSRTEDDVWSPVGRLATNHAWLLHRDGQWCTPSTSSLDDLHPDFLPRDESLAKRLGMQSTPLADVARSWDINTDDLRLILQNPSLVKELADRVRPREHDGNGSVEQRTEQPGTTTEQHEAAGAVDVEAEMRAVFNRPGHTNVEETWTSGQAADPARRRERGAVALQADKTAEPPLNMRPHQVNRTEWEARDPAIREYLRQTYAGRCQICGQTFAKTDGQPYFEARYLVPRTHARWLDRPGNSICLCPTCFAKLLYGQVTGLDVIDQIRRHAAHIEEATDGVSITFELCGEVVSLSFAQKHLIDVAILLDPAG